MSTTTAEQLPECANPEVGHKPDDLPEPGDRCRYCGRELTWMGPGMYDWALAGEDETDRDDATGRLIAWGRLTDKARRTVRRDQGTDRPGARWRIGESLGGLPGMVEYRSVRGTVHLTATDDGTAYQLNAFDLYGNTRTSRKYKTLRVALVRGPELLDNPA